MIIILGTFGSEWRPRIEDSSERGAAAAYRIYHEKLRSEDSLKAKIFLRFLCLFDRKEPPLHIAQALQPPPLDRPVYKLPII